MLWYFYSVMSILFIGVLIADLLLIWGVGYTQGVLVYVNQGGEGFQEQLEFLSVVPWVTITFFRTFEDALQPSTKNVRMTADEWKAFRQWFNDFRSKSGPTMNAVEMAPRDKPPETS
jgi:hypothetical protein